MKIYVCDYCELAGDFHCFKSKEHRCEMCRNIKEMTVEDFMNYVSKIISDDRYERMKKEFI